MRTRLALMALLVGVTALSRTALAATFLVPVPELVGQYKWPDGVELPPWNMNIGDLQRYVTVMKKNAQVDAGMQFQSISQVRLHLVGSITKWAWIYPAMFTTGGGVFPQHLNAFDETIVLSSPSTSLLDGQDTISLCLMFDTDFIPPDWPPPPPPPAIFDPPEGTITAAILEIDGERLLQKGDINGDGFVNVGDLQLFVAAWGSRLHDPAYNNGPSPNWNPLADLNGDGVVNIGDLQILVQYWGNQ